MSSQAMQLTGTVVESVAASQDGTLELRFSNGQSLAFYDDMPAYESYTIRFSDREIIV